MRSLNLKQCLDVSQGVRTLQAGLPFGLDDSSAWHFLSLEHGHASTIEQWLKHQNVLLAISRERIAFLISQEKLLGIDRQAKKANTAFTADNSLYFISLPQGADIDTVRLFAQGNPAYLQNFPLLLSDCPPPLASCLLDYLKLAETLPAALALPSDANVEIEKTYQPPIFPAFVLQEFHTYLAQSLTQVGATPIPLEDIGDTRMHLFRDCLGNESHVAIEVGHRPKDLDQPILVRIHSSCITGDIFHSQRCDCGHQLKVSLQTMAQRGYGLLIYLSQEGRGIGLNNKLKSYLLQQAGLDTVDGNLALGFQDEERNFTYANRILSLMGASKVRLLTNNPKKIKTLEHAGIQVVERIPLIEIHNDIAHDYLNTKARKSGHIL